MLQAWLSLRCPSQPLQARGGATKYCGGRQCASWGWAGLPDVGVPPSVSPLPVPLPCSCKHFAHGSTLRPPLLHPMTTRRLCSGLLCTGTTAGLVRLQAAQMESNEAEAEEREEDGGGARPEGAAEEEVGGCPGVERRRRHGRGECRRWMHQGSMASSKLRGSSELPAASMPL